MPSIVIIGAGMAGLCAATELRKNGVSDFVIVEASDHIGGRIMMKGGFTSWGMTGVGAEFIHGRGPMFEIMQESGATIRELYSWCLGDAPWADKPAGDGGAGYVYLGKSKLLLPYDTKHPEFCRFKELVRQLYDGEIVIEKDQNFEEFLRSRGFSDEIISLADGGFANTVCAPLNKLSMRELVELMAIWDKYGGDGDFRPDEGMIHGVNHLAAPIKNKIKTNWVVKSVDYTNERVVVTSQSGEVINARRVLVTVPITVLRDNDIAFNPPLPEEKMKILRQAETNTAMKVVLRCKYPFWPKDFHGAICSDSFIPEIWVDGPQRPGQIVAGNNGQNPLQAEYLMIGFVTSQYAQRVKSLSKESVTALFLDQLDKMFASKDNLHPATKAHDGGVFMFDWADIPHVRMAYSSIPAGCSAAARETMRRNLNQRIFFAGEGYAANSLVVDGAIISGREAAQEILSARRSSGSCGCPVTATARFLSSPRGILFVAAAAGAYFAYNRYVNH